MVLVILKNILFPKSRSSPPLLPTNGSSSPLETAYGTTTCQSARPRSASTAKEFNPNTCPSTTCPFRPSSSASSSTANSANSDGNTDNETRQKRLLDPRVISDAIIGLSDGLTVPFALTAGLSAFNDTDVVLYGGFAELIAGSISMGLGGWLAGRGEAEFYENTLSATTALVMKSREGEDREEGEEVIKPMLLEVFEHYNLPADSVAPLISSLLHPCKKPELLHFLMTFHHHLPPPPLPSSSSSSSSSMTGTRTPLSSALTIALSYFLGGLLPLLPYAFVDRRNVLLGLKWSVGVMVVLLWCFGAIKVLLVTEGGWKEKGLWRRCCRGGVEMVGVGGVAAAAAMGIVRMLDR